MTTLATITAKVRVPRALAVPYRLGMTLGEPNAPEVQKQIIRAAFALLGRADVPVLEGYTPS